MGSITYQSSENRNNGLLVLMTKEADTLNDFLGYLDSAIKQFEFSLKLWHYLQEYPIQLKDFDIPLTIEEGASRIVMSEGTFTGYGELIVASENITSMCFGSIAIVLWKAIQHADYVLPKSITQEKDELASLVYMIRCAFAHDMAKPRWNIKKEKYNRKYRIGSHIISLIEKDGKIFSYQDIGGAEMMLVFIDMAGEYFWPNRPPSGLSLSGSS